MGGWGQIAGRRGGPADNAVYRYNIALVFNIKEGYYYGLGQLQKNKVIFKGLATKKKELS